MRPDMWCPNCAHPVRPQLERGSLGWLAWVLLPVWWLLAAILISFWTAALLGWNLRYVTALALSLPLAPLAAIWVSGLRRAEACPNCRTRALEPARG
jgi:membrane protein implicated in regulation of membrane protease activity